MWSAGLSEDDTINWTSESTCKALFLEDKTPPTLKRRIETADGKESCRKRRRICLQKRSLKRSLSFGDTPSNDDPDQFGETFSDETPFIADGTRPYCLPVVPGQHRDLKTISADTMRDLLNGCYDDVISKYRVIDCRYPYEFDGGHIKNAENRYLEEQIEELLVSAQQNPENEIIIFHCEFSSKRGPKMYRYLRNKDREVNGSDYPKLYFPEIYLLDGGYKSFYEKNTALCNPMSYLPMLHEDHKADVRHYRSKKSTLKRNCFGRVKNLVLPQKLVFPLC